MSKAELLRLVEESGFVFRGKVVGKGAPGVPLAAAEANAVRVQVDRIVRSTEVLRGFAGREVVVIAESASAVEEGSEFFFFTNVVSLGNEVVVRGLGDVKASRETAEEVTEAVRLVQERPLRERVTGAELIVTGRVIASRRAEEPSVMRSEHDPEWWIARVEVQSVLKSGKAEKEIKEIEVLFANSTDIAWYKAPKLHERASGILLLRRVREKQGVPEVARSMWEEIDPLDFLPLDRLEEVERLLGREKGNR